MSENRAARGVPLPTLSQWLLIAAVAGVVWLAWSQRHGSDADSQVAPVQENSTASAVNHLQAVEAIARTGRDGVSKLVVELSNASPRIRRNVLLALSQIGPDAEEALGPIRECLRDSDMQTRLNAIAACRNICQGPVDLTRAVAPLLTDDVPEVRLAAVKTLEAIGRPGVYPLIELLQGEYAALRIPGLKVVRRIGWDHSQPQIEEAVRQLAGEPDPAVRMEALLTLVKWGHVTAVEIRDLLKEKYPDEYWVPRQTFELDSRDAALAAIIQAGPAAAEYLPDVMSLILKGPDSRALAALRAMKDAALPAAADLLRVSEQAPMRLRIEIGWTLLEIGADGNDVTPLVTPLPVDQIQGGENNFHAGRLCVSASPEEARRQVSLLIPQLTPGKLAAGTSALYAIWGLAPEAQEAVPALTILLDHSNPWIVMLAAESLADVGPAAAPAVPALLAALQRHPPKLDSPVRPAIFTALGKLGPAARSAVPDLLALLSTPRFLQAGSSDPRKRDQWPELSVIRVLVRIGDTDPAVVPALRLLLASERGDVRLAALEALVRLMPNSPEVLREVVRWMEGSDQGDPLGLIVAIGNMTIEREEAVDPLIRKLRHSSPWICKAAAWSLGRIGPAAEAALPALRESLKDVHESPDNLATRIDQRRFDDLLRTKQQHELMLAPLGLVERRRFGAMSFQDVLREAISAIESGNGK